jgi:hypothetical protein
MKPKTIAEAKDQGYDAGRDTSGMTGYYQTWPTEEDMNTPDDFVRAYQEGYNEGVEDRHIPTPSWAFNDDYVRSDATPGL